MKRILPFLILAVGLTACKEAEKTPALTEEDTQIIQTSVAQALADRNDGVITELYDVTNALRFGAPITGSVQNERPPRPGQGSERNYSRTYDPATGKHVISYEHSITMPNVSKSMSVYQEYIFTNPDGAFVQFPGRQEVATTAFTGRREGSLTTPHSTSQDTRRAQWTMTGLQRSSSVIVLNGTQSNSGIMTVTLRDGNTASREFSMALTFADVNIDKAFETDSKLEDKVSGTITFEHTMKHTLPTGEIREKTNSGSIELTGDGRALLRIMGIRTLFRINLATGDVDSGS
jgi:hypothetical protein